MLMSLTMNIDMSTKKTTVTRFAPSPTGYLHLGHAYSALFTEKVAREAEGRFLLRIEDIDLERSRPEFEEAIFEDLTWLGLGWEEPVRRQSDHLDDYHAALEILQEQDLLYPCFCTRKDIRAEIKAAGGAPHGPEGPHYPGTCRALNSDERAMRIKASEPFALRLDMETAINIAGPQTWQDLAQGTQSMEAEQFGDVVLARKETPASYHLAVTYDDHLQGVTLVTRGEDLFHSTPVHRLLQVLLGYDEPAYHHHGLLVDMDGKKFSKRDKSVTIRSLRERGLSPEEVRGMAWNRAPA